MAKYIHNISGLEKTYQGKVISSGDYYLIPPPMYNEFSEDESLIADIQSGIIVLSRGGINHLSTIENNLSLLSPNCLS